MTVMIVLLFVLGVIFGSFINALVWRLAQQEQLLKIGQRTKGKEQSKRAARDYSILRGRSMCPSCGHTLAARDLVPVLSWVILAGNCRYCKKPISRQYPLVELLTGLLFALVYEAMRHEQYAGVLVAYGCAYTVFFLALGMYDLKWFLLPDRLVYPLIAIAGSQVLLLAYLTSDWAILGGAVFGAATVFGIFGGIYAVSKGEWIGGGDVKLAIALGLIAGTPMLGLLVIFLASLLGTTASLPLLVRSRKKGLMTHLPFGPYLLGACFIVLLSGYRFIDWYQGLFL